MQNPSFFSDEDFALKESYASSSSLFNTLQLEESFISPDLISTPEDNSLSSSDYEETSEQVDNGSFTKRRKRGLRRYEKKDAQGNWIIPHVPLPRIPKQDIRRSYGQMIVNVCNSGSRQLMGDFLHQMMNEHGRFTWHRHGYHFQLVRGRDMLADYWHEVMLETPDMTFRFEPKQIKVRSDGTAVVSGIYRLGGTMIFSSDDQRRRKADWRYMTNSFRLNGNEIVPINSTASVVNDNEVVPPTEHTVTADEEATTSRHYLPQTLIASESNPRSKSDFVTMTNAFLRQQFLEARSGGNTSIMVDYQTQGIFSLHIDANYRLDGVDMMLDRYYLNHQLAP